MQSITFGFTLALLLGSALMARADQVFFDFENNPDLAKIQARDMKLSSVRDGNNTQLRLESGHKEAWPGITLEAPGGAWNLSAFDYLLMDVKNAGDKPVTVNLRVDNPGADGINNCNNGSISLGPNASGTLKVQFNRRGVVRPDIKLFGIRGYPVGQKDAPGTIDPAKVNALVVFLNKPSEDYTFTVDNIRAGGTYVPVPPPPADKPFFPFIDTFGQYVHRDWPGKVHSLDELKQRVQSEETDLRQNVGPHEWNQYGGWAGGPQLEATGFFRTAKHNGKWWLVDPEGRLFWSHGIDCVRSMDGTPITERETWFADFPGAQPELKEFAWTGYSLHGHYAGKTSPTYNFAGANLKRKFGDTWRLQADDFAHRRFRSWGMNTIANWSSWEVRQMRRTPYVATVGTGGKMIEGSEGYWGKFRDVFDPDFKEQTRKNMAGQVGKTAGDPWCLGFFVDNELSWGDDTSLAIAALKSPPEQAAKQVFVNDLKAKYGDIAKLNAIWGTQHASWEALLQSREAPDKTKAADDLGAFYSKTAETYFKTVRDAVKEVAPKQLYLGCRFAWVNGRAVAAAAKHCDVVSYNLYRRTVADFQLPIEADVPLIIGEFHFGALDRGMFHTGLVKTANQNERAQVYKDYVQGALRHPQFVGTHWFQYQDQPTTGRVYDEENYQIGFVDITDTPYPETIAAAREVGYNMYRYRLGSK